MPAAIRSIATPGEHLQWNPHIRSLVMVGGFRADACFDPCPAMDAGVMRQVATLELRRFHGETSGTVDSPSAPTLFRTMMPIDRADRASNERPFTDTTGYCLSK